MNSRSALTKRLSFIQMTGVVVCLPGAVVQTLQQPHGTQVSNFAPTEFPRRMQKWPITFFDKCFVSGNRLENGTFGIWRWRLSVLRCRQVSRLKSREGFKQALVLPPSLSCLRSCLSAWIINDLRKATAKGRVVRQKTLQPVKCPAGECFTITPFISTLNINHFPLA